MGAVMFFLMFLLLIPVGSVIVNVLDRLGFMGDMNDPQEWDDNND